jgi:hypothetical protein
MGPPHLWSNTEGVKMFVGKYVIFAVVFFILALGFLMGWLSYRNRQSYIKNYTGKLYPYDEGNYINLGPEVFTDKDETVISYKGENFYRGCGAFVRRHPDGGASYCVRRFNHLGKTHEDYRGFFRRDVA